MRVVFASILCLMALYSTSVVHAAPRPQLLQGSEAASDQHRLSLGGINLFNIGGSYSKAGAIGQGKKSLYGSDERTVTGASAGGSGAFNFGLGPLQYENTKSASAQTSLFGK